MISHGGDLAIGRRGYGIPRRLRPARIREKDRPIAMVFGWGEIRIKFGPSPGGVGGGPCWISHESCANTLSGTSLSAFEIRSPVESWSGISSSWLRIIRRYEISMAMGGNLTKLR